MTPFLNVQSLLSPSFWEDSRRVRNVPLVCIIGDYKRGRESNAGMTMEEVKRSHVLEPTNVGQCSTQGTGRTREPCDADYLVKQNEMSSALFEVFF